MSEPDEVFDEAGAKPLDQFIEEAAALPPSDDVILFPAPSDPVITGGEGHGSADARQLVVIQKLADRSGNTKQERLMLLDSDMREAMALAARRLNAEAMKYSAQGFEWDVYDIAYNNAGPSRTITATLRIARNGA